MLGRVHDLRPAAAVGEALLLIPMGLRDHTACEFIIGVDPAFAGIHPVQTVSAEYSGGWAYKDLAHCLYSHGQMDRPASDRGTKVILPTNPAYRWGTWGGVETVVHELGHVLHESIGFDHIAAPVTSYAETNRWEAFAEAFAAWVWGRPIDERTQALLDGLA